MPVSRLNLFVIFITNLVVHKDWCLKVKGDAVMHLPFAISHRFPTYYYPTLRNLQGFVLQSRGHLPYRKNIPGNRRTTSLI